MTFLAVALGGAAGTLARYGIGSALAPVSARFPVATLLINVVGSFVIGWAIADAGPAASFSPALRAALTVGFCGGFTTFSGFSFETVRLVQRGDLGRAAAYATLSVALCLVATIAGMALARTTAPRA